MEYTHPTTNSVIIKRSSTTVYDLSYYDNHGRGKTQTRSQSFCTPSKFQGKALGTKLGWGWVRRSSLTEFHTSPFFRRCRLSQPTGTQTKEKRETFLTRLLTRTSIYSCNTGRLWFWPLNGTQKTVQPRPDRVARCHCRYLFVMSLHKYLSKNPPGTKDDT